MATTFNQGALVAPAARRSVSDLIDTLQSCWTDSQLRAWLSATFSERQRLGPDDLSRIERERQRRQVIVEQQERARMIAERKALLDADRAFVARLRQIESSRHHSPILRDACKAMAAHNLSPSRFGRLACNDPKLIHDLEKGRTVGPALEAKVRAYIAQLEGGAR